MLFGNNVVVLFDLGATHSFVSNEYMMRLRLVLRKLGCELIVVTPTSSEVSTTTICVGCPMDMAGRRFKVNLICFPRKGDELLFSSIPLPFVYPFDSFFSA